MEAFFSMELSCPLHENYRFMFLSRQNHLDVSDNSFVVCKRDPCVHYLALPVYSICTKPYTSHSE